MELAGGNADLGAKAEFAPVGELGGGIVQDNGAVNFVQKSLGGFFIISNDRIGLLLHHKVMDDAAFALLSELLQLFNRFSIIQRHTFQSLLKPNR